MGRPSTGTTRKWLRLPPHLWRELDELARQERRTRDLQIQVMLESRLGKQPVIVEQESGTEEARRRLGYETTQEAHPGRQSSPHSVPKAKPGSGGLLDVDIQTKHPKRRG